MLAGALVIFCSKPVAVTTISSSWGGASLSAAEAAGSPIRAAMAAAMACRGVLKAFCCMLVLSPG